MLRKIINWWKRTPPPPPPPQPRRDGLALAVTKAQEQPQAKKFPVQPPQIMAGVVPSGAKSGIAMDANFNGFYPTCSYGDFTGFPGYPYLAALDTRAEFRAMSSSLATEITREWIELNSTETAGDSTKAKVTELTQKLKDIGLQTVIRKAVEQDCKYGRAQILINIDGQDLNTPLIPSPKTIKKGAVIRISTVEALWTTPNAYNAANPAAPDFYVPSQWFMLGKEVHKSRLLTIITRELPDMLKPAFNFGGMSLYQIAEPYVDNWLRTRQSVSDLINNFSITALQTNMGQVLQGSDDGSDLFRRAELFTATRSNKGLMVLDKDSEALVQANTPLGGLHELQAQSQEHMCAVSRMPAVVLTGIEPTGLNASSEGSIVAHENWIAAQQEAFWRRPIETILNLVQLSEYGEIDPDIVVTFRPLRQMTPKDLADIRTADSTTDAAYIDRGVLDPMEVREKLARDPESGYQGIDVDAIPTPEDDDNEEDAQGN